MHEALNVGAARAAHQAGAPAVAFNIGLGTADLARMLLPMVGAPTNPIIDPVPPTWRGEESVDEGIPIRSVLETAERCARVLVAVGPDGDPAALVGLPGHVRVERYVDQPRAVAESDVVVHHGGTGTVLACLAAGVPQLVTPQGADQFMNADRLVELGLGCAVGNDAPDGEVESAVDRLLTDPDVRRRVAALRDEVAAMPDPDDVVAELERRWGPA